MKRNEKMKEWKLMEGGSRHLEGWELSRGVVKVATWRALHSEDKTKEESTQDSLNTLIEFLFYSKFNVSFMRQDTLFIGMGSLVGKMGGGVEKTMRGAA